MLLMLGTVSMPVSVTMKTIDESLGGIEDSANSEAFNRAVVGQVSSEVMELPLQAVGWKAIDLIVDRGEQRPTGRSTFELAWLDTVGARHVGRALAARCRAYVEETATPEAPRARSLPYMKVRSAPNG